MKAPDMSEPQISPNTTHIKGDKLSLSSGNCLDVNQGIIGLSPGGDITHGLDGYLSIKDGEDPCQIAIEDRKEIADYMILKWKNYRDSLEVSTIECEHDWVTVGGTQGGTITGQRCRKCYKQEWF